MTMDMKLVLIVVLLVLTIHQQVEAEFFYNRVLPKQEDLSSTNYKCVPGRTVIKLETLKSELSADKEFEEQSSEEYLRSHMKFQTDDESCQICVCSVEGKNQHCSRRPAKNVNECIRMATSIADFKKNLPYDHEKSLAFRIRRDYIWHNDEIPYEAKAKCRRGHSYYSNSITANVTDIDLGSDIESLIDYSNTGICYYCVCSFDGNGAGCLRRNPWYCEYFRIIRTGDAPRDMYTSRFEQDRPVYFRSLSWRLRRTMDNGMFDLMDTVGSETDLKYCVPYVSQYTDCTEENLCSGCSKCTCSAEGKWDCDTIRNCPNEAYDFKDFDDNDIEKALNLLQIELSKNDKSVKAASKYPLVPEPDDKMEDLILEVKEENMEDEIIKLMERMKRSVGDKENDTITFYHTVDELNEDTLNKQNSSGTIPAQKVDTLPTISRRASMLNNETSNAFRIKYTQQKEHHDDNKVDTPAIHDDREDLLVHGSNFDGMGNGQSVKDKELSKIIANELKGGVSETIGDKKAPVISNITFTPENDTLTAMAFIAGNLLNRLWNMEKSSSDNIDTEVLKHEKIANLLDLFKEPLNMRQEMFLKNSLEQLYKAITQTKKLKNISVCKQIGEAKKLLVDKKVNENDEAKSDCNKNKQLNKKSGTAEALDKINAVLDLIKKYENIQDSLITTKSRKVSDISRLNNGNIDVELTKDEKSSLDLYGKALGALTKLLIPNNNNKKVINSIQNSNLYKTEKGLQNKLSDMKLGNLNVTAKDKMVLDYLTHIQNYPNCLLKKQNEIKFLPSVEGNILLNLSELFKIKSLSELMKLVDTEKLPESISNLKDVTTPIIVEEKTTEFIKKNSPKQFQDKKERLQEHLKAILEDLIELQTVDKKGTNNKDVHIKKVLPCIYNLMNVGTEETKTPKVSIENKTTSLHISHSEKMQQILRNLKNEWKVAQTRRTNTLSGPRPKSAIVWERVLKNAEGKRKLKTRRILGEAPKTIEELKVIIYKLESLGSNMYKNYAILNEVPPSERLILLKTFNADTSRYIKVLNQVQLALEDKFYIPKEDAKELNEAVDNVAINIKLNEIVVKKLDKPKMIKGFANTEVDPTRLRNKVQFKLKQSIIREQSYNTKLTRDQIINQLIKNHVQLYVETKEATHETFNDVNYDIAKRILFHLQVGNYKVAREMYNMLTKQKDTRNDDNLNIGVVKEQLDRRFAGRLQIEPLIKLEGPKTVNKVQKNQDHFIKQLLNLKNKF